MLAIFAVIIGFVAAQCPNTDQYCARCVGPVCPVCYSSIFDGKACVVPSKTVDRCMVYNPIAGNCFACVTGYYLDASNKCVAITDNSCYVYSLTDKCIACKNSILAINGTCSDTTKKCSDANCSVCSNDNQCGVCKSGFIFDIYKKCIPGKGISNCMDFGPTECNFCDYGYYYKDGVCVAASYKSSMILSGLVSFVIAALF